MAFVSRVRSSVRKSAEVLKEQFLHVDDLIDLNFCPPAHLLAGTNCKVSVCVEGLDDSELDKDGARAIFEAQGNVALSKFIGVNQAFCDMFGFDRSEFQGSSFRMLQGAFTDTRHLQEAWSEVRKGSTRAITCTLHSKQRGGVPVRMECLLRMADAHQSQCVVVVRLVLHQEPTHRDTPRRSLFRARDPRPKTSSSLREQPEEELERLLRGIEDAVPRTTLERLRRSMEGMVPKARLEAAEAEISRLQVARRLCHSLTPARASTAPSLCAYTA
jgi:hypothetical protein